MHKTLLLLLSLMLICNLSYGGASRGFDGVDDDIDFTYPTEIVIGTDSFVMMTWVRWTQGADTADEVILANKDNGGTGRSIIQIDDDGSFCSTDDINSFLGAVNNCGNVLLVNTWLHAAVRSDEAAGTIDFLENGIETASTTGAPEASTGELKLGRHKSLTTLDYEGQLSMFIYVEGALTDPEIAEIQYIPQSVYGYASPSNVRLFSPLMEGTSANEPDLSGNGSIGTQAGGTLESAEGPPIMIGGFYPL